MVFSQEILFEWIRCLFQVFYTQLLHLWNIFHSNLFLIVDRMKIICILAIFSQVLKTTLRSAFQQTQEQNILRRHVDRRELKTKKLPECLCLWPWCSLEKFHVRSVMTAFITCPFVFIDTKFHCDVICTINLALQFTIAMSEPRISSIQ